MKSPRALGRPAIGVLAVLLLACTACGWLAWAELGGLRFNPSTEALIDPSDLSPADRRREELMILLTADSPLTAAQLTAVDRITTLLEEQANGAAVRSLTTIQIPVSYDDSVELLSIRGWLEDADAQSRVPLNTLLDHPLITGRLVSADHRAAGIHITFAPNIISSDAQARALILVDTARAAAGSTPLSIAATGGPLVSHAISSSLQTQLQQVLPLLALAFVIVLLVAFRCIRLVLVAVASVTLAVIAALTALALIGGTLNLVTTLIVPLVATLTVAYQMHLLSATDHHDDADQGAKAIALPVLVTALTTAVGLLALAVHPTPAIRSFALASALGVASSALITRYWSPAAMSLLGACPESMLMDNDVLGAALRITRGIEVNDQTLGFDVLKDVCLGNKGHYLGAGQTLEVMQTEYIYPDLGDRLSPNDWAEQGKPVLLEKALARKKEILENYFPNHVSDEVDQQIREQFRIFLPRSAFGRDRADSEAKAVEQG